MFNIFKFLKKIFYGFSFGMKEVDNILFTAKSNESDIHEIHQNVNQKSVYKDLINGEVTQEVEELRYKTYYVYSESKKYKYLGNGLAERKENINTFNINNFSFSQPNKETYYTTYDLSTIDSLDNLYLKINYEEFCKYKHENHVTKIDVNVDVKRKSKPYLIYLYYNAYQDKHDIYYNIFLKKLKSKNLKDKDIFPNFKNLSFTTFNAQGINDLYRFVFFDLKPLDVFEKDGNVIVEYTFSNFNCENLIEKYFSDSLHKKYQNKQSKIDNTLLIKTDNFHNIY